MDKNTHSVQELLSANRVDVDPNYAAQVQESVLEEVGVSCSFFFMAAFLRGIESAKSF